MSPSEPAGKVWLFLVVSMACMSLGGTGCSRAARPDMGLDRTVEAGVPVELGSARQGAPVLSWDLGDGTPPRVSAHIVHVYERAGIYVVRSLEGSEELGRVEITVVPRPVLRAIPADALAAVYMPQQRGAVEVLMSTYERLLPQAEQVTMSETPYVSMLRVSERGGSKAGVDLEEGFGLFLMPGFNGWIALQGVADGRAAMDAVLKYFEEDGHDVKRRGDGSAWVDFDRTEPITLFVDRGYLYMVIPTETSPLSGGFFHVPPAEPRDVEGVSQLIRSMRGPGLSESPLIQKLGGKVEEGNFYFLIALQDPAQQFSGLFTSIRLRKDRVKVDGVVDLERPFPTSGQRPASAFPTEAPLGPIAAGTLSVSADEIATLLFGTPGSPRREKAVEEYRKNGIDIGEIVDAFRGDVSMLVYFDAAGFYKNIRTTRRPELRGSIMLEAGVTRPKLMVTFFEKVFASNSLAVEKQQEGGATVLQTRARNQPVTVTVSSDRMVLRAGESLEARPLGDVKGAVRERFGDRVSDVNSLTVLLDVGRLRAEVNNPGPVQGISPMEIELMKLIANVFLDQLPPIDQVFVDLALGENLGRFKGQVVFRNR